MIMRPDFDNMIRLNTYRAGEFLNRDTTLRLHQDTATTLGVDLGLALILIYNYFSLGFIFSLQNYLRTILIFFCTYEEKVPCNQRLFIVLLTSSSLSRNSFSAISNLESEACSFSIISSKLHSYFCTCI